MIVAVHVEDVATHLLVERAVLHAEELGDLHPREGRALRAQEEGGGLAIEHEVAELRLRQPRALGQVGHRRVEALAAQRGVEEVELGKVELGERRHRVNRNARALNLDG